MIRRLLLTYLSLTVLVLCGLAVPLGWIYQRSERQQAFQSLQHEATVLAAYIGADLEGAEGDRIADMARAAARQWDGEVEVFDGAGRVLFSTRDGRAGPLPVAGSRIARLDGVAVLSVTEPFRSESSGAVRLSAPLAPVTRSVHQFWFILAVASLIVLAVVVGVAVALARWVARPVRALEHATRNLAAGGEPTLVPDGSGPPELRRLAATFNTTAVRLHELLDAQRSFADHASHQLKSPLQALRLRLENLEPDVTPAGEEGLEAALAEAERLSRMVDTLLDMAVTDHPDQAPQEVDLTALAAERAEVWRPLAGKQDVTLALTDDGPARVPAMSGAVEQILDNLLSNALRAAPAGSTVTIVVRAGQLRVVDHGPGLSDEQRTAALEPFWRAPGSAPGGTGLGLALVRKLAVAGGGSVRLDPAVPSGIEAVVTFSGRA
ncbi:HAMP domain-containing histidine kinase [Actinoplanes bogorensis]|uniref:histidine kinase n=1 Tax=Paractinoplanes bogorensis TaxID=1610840 RepID=A0ABS5YYS8_9ACTN|nr:HAMP domain-containing sensor histidine kinase [Actinoplanes bogorensis]MBU2667863.1 HAMP domain-containing histidine kinase [Actinoplanes bogorensis]